MNWVKKHWIKLALLFYAFLHIAQLEWFPFYHFAMYSQRIHPQTQFTTYTLVTNDESFDFTEINYRRYIYLTNTFKAYDAMRYNQGCHPQAQIISKYFRLLGMEDQAQAIIQKNYCSHSLEADMHMWLEGFTSSPDNNLYRVTYLWTDNGQPIVKDSIRIL